MYANGPLEKFFIISGFSLLGEFIIVGSTVYSSPRCVSTYILSRISTSKYLWGFF